MRRAALLAVAALLALAAAPAAGATVLPPIHHVYVIVLENESVSTTFGANSPAPYLAKTLRAEGAYLPAYYGVGHESNDNYIAMISGQAPNAESQADCQFFADFPAAATGAYGQQEGAGCVYPSSIPTIADQFELTGLTWRDYNEDMGNTPTRETSVCGHPPVNGQDGTQSATAADHYATRHDPFVYFHSIIDDTTRCDLHVVNLDPLSQDLARPDAPNYVFITPNLCNDGHDSPCAGGGPGGLAQADSFLRAWVPRITSSPSFRLDGGLLAIIFDEAATSDTSACCGELAGPGSPEPGINGPGGGDVGAVLLSPYIHGGTVSPVPYNHYSLLRSVEDLFRLPHLGYAQLPGESSFGTDVFACEPAATPIASQGRLPSGSEIRAPRVVRSGGRAALSVQSVGTSHLVVVVSARHRRTRVLRRMLLPCQSYTVALPYQHARLKVAAFAGGGQDATALRF